jgi:hypothetical protein
MSGLDAMAMPALPCDDRPTAALERHGLGDGGQDALGNVHHLLLVQQLVAQHDELVPTDPSHGVLRAKDAIQAPCHLDQKLVSCGVPEAVVDELEIVEVEEYQGDLPAASRLASQRVAESIHQQAAVRQAREGVVQSLPRQFVP